MSTAATTTTALARSRAYGFLSLAFGEPDAALLELLQQQCGALEADFARLRDRTAAAAARRLRPALAPLAIEELKALHLGCFGHAVSKDCPPYEGEYGQAHVFQQTQTLADIAGFYRAFGLELAADFHERIDHLGIELEFMHFLCRKEAHGLQERHAPERIARGRAAQAQFLSEHLGAWVPQFAARLRARDARGLYGRLGDLLDAFVRGELRRFGVEPGAIARPSAAAPEAMQAGSCAARGCGVAAESEAL